MITTEVVEQRTIIRNTMYLDKIHPCILKGLVPVDGPVFIGLDGQEKRLCTNLVQEEGIHLIPNKEETCPNNWPLLGKCIDHALKLEWNYIHCIIFDYNAAEEMVFNIKIRGTA